MWKKLGVALSAAMLAFTLSACSSGATTDEASESAPSTEVTQAQESADANDEATESDAGAEATTDNATAEAEDTVVVYSTHPEKILEAISDEFTAKTGINVEFINLKGELADRVASEIDNPQADVMYGGDISVYMTLDEKGAFQATDPSWASELSDEFKASDGTWYSTIKTPVMMFYNTDVLEAADAPTDWTDLTDAKYKDQIVARDYLSSSMRAAICNLIYYFEQDGGQEAAENYLSGLDANVKNYYNSGSMMFKAIGAGEAEVGIATLSDIMDNATNNGMPLKQINATSGNVIISDCVAAINKCQHPNAAAQFVEFVGSKDVEVMLAEDFNRMPVLPAALAEAPEWMQEPLNTLPCDWKVIAENQTAWLDLWQNNLYTEDKTVASS